MTESTFRDAADPVVGWRYWQLSPDGARLRSVSQRRFEWAPDRPLRAACVAGGHGAPDAECNCGIYGARDIVTLREHGLCLTPDVLVVGQVSLWGRIIVHEHAYRAEYAHPKTLSLVRETVDEAPLRRIHERLAAYGVPVDTTTLEGTVGEISAATLAFQAMSRQTSMP